MMISNQSTDDANVDSSGIGDAIVDNNIQSSVHPPAASGKLDVPVARLPIILGEEIVI